MASPTTDTTSLNSAQASEYEDAESGAPASYFFSYISVIVVNSFFPADRGCFLEVPMLVLVIIYFTPFKLLFVLSLILHFTVYIYTFCSI